MHYLTYVLVPIGLKTEEAVATILAPWEYFYWDWYEIGGNWEHLIKADSLPIAQFLETEIPDGITPNLVITHKEGLVSYDTFEPDLELANPTIREERWEKRVREIITAYSDSDFELVVVDLHC